MAGDFNRQLGIVSGEAPSPVAPIVDHSSVFVTEAVTSGLSLTRNIMENEVKKSLAEDLIDVTAEENNFKDARKQIEDQLITSKDKAMIDELHGKLMSLENGKVAGAIHPMEAEIRSRALLAQYTTLNPWMAADFKSVAASIRGSGASGERVYQTPEQMALDELRKKARLNGISLSAQMELQQSDLQLVETEKLIKMKEAAGKLVYADVLEGTRNTAKIASQSIFAQAFSVVQQDPAALDSTDWYGHMLQAKTAAKDRILQLERGANFLLTDEQRARADKIVDDEFAMVEQYIKSKDKKEYLSRVKSIVNDTGFLTMGEMNPYFAFMTANGAGDAALDLAFRVWPKFLAQVQKHGSFDTAQLLKDNLGDPDAIQFINAVQYNKGVYVTGLYNKMKKGVPGTNNYEEVLLKGMAGMFITNPIPKDDKELQAARDAAHTKLTEAGSLKDLDYYLSPNAAKELQDSPKNLAKLKTAVDFRASSLINTAPLSMSTFIKDTPVKTQSMVYDEASGKFMVQDARAAKIQGVFPDRSIPMTESAHTLGLNKLMKLMSMYNMFPTNKWEWIDQVLKQANQEVTVPNEPAAQ